MTWPRRLAALLLAPLLVGTLVGLTTTPAAADDTDPVGVWPLRPDPEVVRGFDPPDVVWGSGHRGVDLLGAPGRPVHAALAGTITFAGVLAGRGVVVVDHGATRTTYEPVSASVAVGDTVAQGGVIGSLATAGSHCLPRSCLHWGWKEGDTYLDPLRLVGAGPVRLLPLWRDEPVPVVTRPFVAPPAASAYATLLATWFSRAWWLPPTRPMPGGAPAGRPAAAGPS